MQTIAQQLKIKNFPFKMYDEKGNEIYWETSNGFWYKYKRTYNEKGNSIYLENSDGNWIKYKYDEKGNEIYYENSDGYWQKKEYDEKGNLIYLETSNDELKQPTLTQKEIIGEIIGDREVLNN